MPKARHPKAERFVREGLFKNLNDFSEFERRVAALPDEQARGDAFEVFAEACLATLRQHDAAEVWPLAAVPLDVLRSLALGTSDFGVDGVVKTPLGHFNAYQVKFRTDRAPLTWRELSTFMGLADSRSIHTRILFTNCDELPAVLNERSGFFAIRGSDLDRLTAAEFQAIENWLADAVVHVPKKTPQPHQAEALAALLPALEQHDRVSAIITCGTGYSGLFPLNRPGGLLGNRPSGRVCANGERLVMKCNKPPIHPCEMRACRQSRRIRLATWLSMILACAAGFAQGDPNNLNSWTLANSVLGASAIAYGNGMFVGISGQARLVSYDGANWTAYTTPPTVYSGGIAYGGGAFLSFGTNFQSNANSILKSTNGMTWTTIYTSSNALTAAAYGNNTWVFVGNNEIVTASVTSSNWNWTEFNLPFYLQTISSITYGNGQFVIVTSGNILSSSDGIAWQYMTAANYNSGLGIVFGNGLFVNSQLAKPPGATDYAYQMYVSSNLVLWATNTVSSSGLSSISSSFIPAPFAFGGGQFVVETFQLGQGGAASDWGIWTSSDGSGWTHRTSLTKHFKTFAYGQGTFVASDGIVIYQSGVFAAESNAPPATLAISTYPGVTINGTVGAAYQIQFKTDLESAWLPLTNFTLPYSPYLWVDTTSPVAGQRLYRSVQLP